MPLATAVTLNVVLEIVPVNTAATGALFMVSAVLIVWLKLMVYVPIPPEPVPVPVITVSAATPIPKRLCPVDITPFLTAVTFKVVPLMVAVKTALDGLLMRHAYLFVPSVM